MGVGGWGDLTSGLISGTCDGIPVRPVGDAVRERALILTAWCRVVHGGVAEGIGLGQVNEHVVVRARRHPRLALSWRRGQDNSHNDHNDN